MTRSCSSWPKHNHFASLAAVLLLSACSVSQGYSQAFSQPIPPSTTTSGSKTVPSDICMETGACAERTKIIDHEMTSATSKFRSVQKILPRPHAHWVGDGFHVYPVFANMAFTKTPSPLLMFDYAAPKEFPAKLGAPKGVGQHPHRGFETVTIAFQGEVEHRDSNGGHGTIHPGDVQWMTAGKGIIHEEFHSKNFTRTGGTFEMCQLWVNLPREYKMVEPRYQAISDASIPVVPLIVQQQKLEENDNTPGPETAQSPTARIIAGSLLEISGPAKTYSPVNLWDVSLPIKDQDIHIPYPNDHNCLVFVRRGSVQVDGRTLGPQDVALMNQSSFDSEHDADAIQLKVLEDDSAVLIMGGEPIDEPLAHMGPFVMNTKEELNEAVLDYRNGRFGRV